MHIDIPVMFLSLDDILNVHFNICGIGALIMPVDIAMEFHSPIF